MRAEAVKWRSVSEYVHSLGLDAYLVGGAVRDELLGLSAKDEDFVVAGVGYDDLRAALEAQGRVEPLEVAGRHVGLRLYPYDRDARALAPAGIEFAPPRRERSTGPGRHDFEIVADASIPLEDDLRRRDFTINAIAKHLATSDIVDPFRGREDLERRVLRTVTPDSFREDPLRIVRGLRFVSQLDLDPDDETRAQMEQHAATIEHVSAERIGGGLAADGIGELSKLLLGARPAKALRLARDTGALVHVLPELAPSIGFDQETRWHELPLDEHVFEAVQAGADAGLPLRIRLALLLHDSGKPAAAWRGKDGRLHYYGKPGRRGHEEIGADIASRALERLRYPTRLRADVRRIVLHHAFALPNDPNAVDARRFLAGHGTRTAFDVVAHREADLRAKGRDVGAELATLQAFRALLKAEQESPHRLRDLAVDGDDLVRLGVAPGPKLGAILERLLADVVVDPSRNTHEWLTSRAKELV